jgi:putative endonuclease
VSKPKDKAPHTYYVYILRCADGTLYTGSTNDLEARERAHNEGRGAKYTAGRGPVRVVCFETYGSRPEAQRREYQIKHWTRARKEAFAAGNARRLHALTRRRH